MAVEILIPTKGQVDSQTVQNATATNIAVPLNQHLHTSFTIKDGEESKSFQDLVGFYLQPAVSSIASMIDKILCAQALHWIYEDELNGACGTDPTDTSAILAARNALNKNKTYAQNRNLLLTPDSETAFLGLDTFSEADKVGDDGSALREAMLGRKLGFNMFMDQNQPIGTLSTSATPTVSTTVATAAAKGATTVVLTSGTSVAAGQAINIGGDIQVVLTVNSATITCYPGLRQAVAGNATVTVTAYKTATVDLTDGYAAGWHKAITYKTMTGLSVGQPLLISAAAAVTSDTLAAAMKPYVVVAAPSATTIVLDRPLDVALVDDSVITILPVGNYNFGFHKNAIALVNRPLAVPRQGISALGATAVYNNMSMRVVITYEGRGQGHLVTVDTLMGVKQLDANLGTLLLG